MILQLLDTCVLGIEGPRLTFTQLHGQRQFCLWEGTIWMYVTEVIRPNRDSVSSLRCKACIQASSLEGRDAKQRSRVHAFDLKASHVRVAGVIPRSTETRVHSVYSEQTGTVHARHILPSIGVSGGTHVEKG